MRAHRAHFPYQSTYRANCASCGGPALVFASHAGAKVNKVEICPRIKQHVGLPLALVSAKIVQMHNLAANIDVLYRPRQLACLILHRLCGQQPPNGRLIRIFLDACAAFAIEPPTASRFVHAGVVKLVDTLVLGTSGASRGGSSPSARTNNAINVCMPNREAKPRIGVDRHTWMIRNWAQCRSLKRSPMA
jgi:hypothetical protein